MLSGETSEAKAITSIGSGLLTLEFHPRTARENAAFAKERAAVAEEKARFAKQRAAFAQERAAFAESRAEYKSQGGQKEATAAEDKARFAKKKSLSAQERQQQKVAFAQARAGFADEKVDFAEERDPLGPKTERRRKLHLPKTELISPKTGLVWPMRKLLSPTSELNTRGRETSSTAFRRRESCFLKSCFRQRDSYFREHLSFTAPVREKDGVDVVETHACDAAAVSLADFIDGKDDWRNTPFPSDFHDYNISLNVTWHSRVTKRITLGRRMKTIGYCFQRLRQGLTDTKQPTHVSSVPFQRRPLQLKWVPSAPGNRTDYTAAEDQGKGPTPLICALAARPYVMTRTSGFDD
ncbi:hypothetical protein FN846DRAFT_887341 [Sphaerosporella brunnea]|uniref:Uncharacterized protein n=1 Tax=Sphaerosporella brunnea TaxID=1250544 RepID=A0A5J5F6W4_9PEZI|nr:hypothetical protein FN846DRAFT_887341 [Sphaerosporella brunnea]